MTSLEKRLAAWAVHQNTFAKDDFTNTTKRLYKVPHKVLLYKFPLNYRLDSMPGHICKLHILKYSKQETNLQFKNTVFH